MIFLSSFLNGGLDKCILQAAEAVRLDVTDHTTTVEAYTP